MRLEEGDLKLKTNKCRFFSTEIELLGHKISKESIKPLERNTEAVIKF